MADRVPDIFFRMDDATIMYRNFSGRKTPFNAEGDRNFCLDLTGEDLDLLVAQGWNVKWTKVKEEGDEPKPYLPVAVRYVFKPPRIVIVKSNGQTPLSEDMLDLLDYVEFTTVDLIVRGWWWEVSGGSGRKAEVKTMFATIFEDELERKYSMAQEPA